MNWVSKKHFATSLMLLAANSFGGTPTSETTKSLPRIRAGVYNLARVDRDILDGAKEQAARILGRAGVRMDLVDCPVSAGEVDEYPGCSALRGDAAIFLRIRTSPTRLSGRRNVYGVALLPKDGGFGKYADVYADAGVVAQRKQMRASVFLGTLLAHEIGHLLLERASHSASGIMSSPWRAGDLVLAAQGSLLFTAKEASLLRDGVRGRLRADESRAEPVLANESTPGPIVLAP